MIPKKLSFFAEGDGLVPDFEAQRAGLRRFVGRKWTEYPDAEGGPSRWGWAPIDEPETVKFSFDYVKLAKAGHLKPADAVTAAACGLPYNE